jgi:hypothetical protein
MRIYKRRLEDASNLMVDAAQIFQEKSSFSAHMSLAKKMSTNVKDSIATLDAFNSYFLTRVNEWRHAFKGERSSFSETTITEADFIKQLKKKHQSDHQLQSTLRDEVTNESKLVES